MHFRPFLMLLLIFPSVGFSGEITIAPYQSMAPYLSALEQFNIQNQQSSPYTESTLKLNGISIARHFLGQHMADDKINDVPGSQASSPLALAKIYTHRNPQTLAKGISVISHANSDYSVAGYYKGSIVFGTRKPTNYINPYLAAKGSSTDGNIDSSNFSYFGTSSVAIKFKSDQRMIGMRFIRLKNQLLPVYRSNNEAPNGGVIYAKFFRRDGSFIAEERFAPKANSLVGFQRCGGIRDIAGVHISSNIRGGLSIDDIIFDTAPLLEDKNPDYEFSECVGFFS